MNAQELRIGNLVMFGELRHECKPCDILNLYQSEIAKREISEYKPIPLTEEWLLKFGFKKINHIHGYSFYSLSKSKKNTCHIAIYNTQTTYMGYSVNHCIYVHQLQNLYFTLTGEELTI
jgi:hypothetical protein